MNIFLIRIVYKSGYTHDFWCKKFSYEKDIKGWNIEWESCDNSNYPLVIGGEEIAAIWQIGVKETNNE